MLRRLTAFTDDPRGGNPAGVWIGRALPEPETMQAIAAEVGYSETAFLAPIAERRYRTRYFSPAAEVSFCGHATIASGVELGRRHGEGTYVLETAVGEVPVVVARRGGRWTAALTSVDTEQRDASPALVNGALRSLGWSRADLDPTIPPIVAYAGAWHLVLAVSRRETLDALDYDFDALRALMEAEGLTTLQLVWRESDDVWHARDPFPVGGVVEDPATGAAAAAFGGYLRDAGLLRVPARFVIHQGEVMGRPSLLEVTVPERGGITVTGGAVPIEAEIGGSDGRPAGPGGEAVVAAAPGVAEALARSFLERVWNAPADLDAIDELMSEDYVIHSSGTTVRGREPFKAWVRSFQERLEGATNEVGEVFADATGSRVTTLWTCRGLNRGLFGLPPDGAPIAFTGIAVWRVEDGRLAECWVERAGLEAVREWEAQRGEKAGLAEV